MKKTIFVVLFVLCSTFALASPWWHSYDSIIGSPVNMLIENLDSTNLTWQSAQNTEGKPIPTMNCPSGDFYQGADPSTLVSYCQEVNTNIKITGWEAIAGYNQGVPTDIKVLSRSTNSNSVNAFIFVSESPISSTTNWHFVGQALMVANPNLETFVFPNTAGYDVKALLIGRGESNLPVDAEIAYAGLTY